MTREEAISILEAFRYISAGKETKDAVITATNMAIEALSEPSRKPDYTYEAGMVKRLMKYTRPTDGDLISRREAIEWLGEEPPVWYDGDDEIAERNQWRRDVAIIKELPSARPTGEWIPCSERLPEDGVAVLITTENEEVYIDQVITDPYKERYFQSNTGYDNFQVIAWMPLPEPYKGGDPK